MKKVICLILSFNGKYLLDDSVSSYIANDYTNFIVVVIDNGSTDGTKEYVERNWPEVKVLRTEKNLAYSGGFNFGLKYAFKEQNADYVLITNNDVKADSKVISELVKVAEQDKMIGFVTGKVYYFDQPSVLQTVGYRLQNERYWLFSHLGANEEDNGQFNQTEERVFADDIFILVARKVYEIVGGYDITFKFHAEQFEWQIRAKKEGFQIFFTPYAKIWHKESMTIGKSSPFKTYYYVRNTFVVRLKHREKEYLTMYYPWYFKNVVIRPFIKYFLKFKWKYSWAILNGYFSAVKWGRQNDKLPI